MVIVVNAFRNEQKARLSESGRIRTVWVQSPPNSLVYHVIMSSIRIGGVSVMQACSMCMEGNSPVDAGCRLRPSATGRSCWFRRRRRNCWSRATPRRRPWDTRSVRTSCWPDLRCDFRLEKHFTHSSHARRERVSAILFRKPINQKEEEKKHWRHSVRQQQQQLGTNELTNKKPDTCFCRNHFGIRNNKRAWCGAFSVNGIRRRRQQQQQCTWSGCSGNQSRIGWGAGSCWLAHALKKAQFS